MKNKLYLIRAVSGAGKTTLARTLAQLPNTVAIACDDYWYDTEGNYNFDIDFLPCARVYCLNNTEWAMRREQDVVVHNTNTSKEAYQPFLDLADEYNYQVISLIIENRHGSVDVHGVPEEALQLQEQELRNDIKLR